jgi:hypothetical protein
MKGQHLVPVAAMAAYFGIGLYWLSGRVGRPEGAFPPASIYEPSTEGASLAFEYLRARRGEQAVAVLLSPLAPGAAPPRAVVFRLRPLAVWASGGRTSPPVSPREHEWLAGGGRLVLGVETPYASLVPSVGKQRPAEKVFPAWPGVRRLGSGPTRRFESGLPVEAVTVFADAEHKPVVARWSVGAGEVVALACPEIFGNGQLEKADHLRLLEALAEPGRPVLFDEAVHGLGSGGGFGPLLLEWGLGPALVVGAAALVLALWRNHARLGPPQDDHEETRREAVDLVDSVALLYERALGRGELLALYYEAVRRQAALKTGLKGAALDARMAMLTDGLPVPNASGTPGRQQFDRALQAINNALDRMEDHAHTR